MAICVQLAFSCHWRETSRADPIRLCEPDNSAWQGHTSEVTCAGTTHGTTGCVGSNYESGWLQWILTQHEARQRLSPGKCSQFFVRFFIKLSPVGKVRTRIECGLLAAKDGAATLLHVDTRRSAASRRWRRSR